MKKLLQSIALLLLLCTLCSLLLACTGPDEVPGGDEGQNEGQQTDKDPQEGNTDPDPVITDPVDYAGQVKLDLSSETLKQEVTIHIYVDGDTTHFKVPKSIEASGILKARYLAVNTPESTGTIEEWGKAASNFTKSKLKSATSIIVESDNDQWNHDSNGRMLVWVWYRTSENEDYRNLNVELLQNGLAIASNSANNRYGTAAMAAIAQAKAQKLYVYSGEKDPNFYYGSSKPVTLKTIRTNPDQYLGVNVAFEGVITRIANNTVYLEDYDEEDGIYYAMPAYYGYNADADLLSMFRVGNRVKLIGSVQYYEAGGTYQISGLKYNVRKPDESCTLISTGNEVNYPLTDAQTFASSKLTVLVASQNEEGESIEEEKTFSYSALAMDTTIAMNDLRVTKIYTTKTEGSSSKGAMTLTCTASDGTTISVRTEVLRENGELVTEEKYMDKTIDVRGLVDYYDGNYQIRVFSVDDIDVKN